MNKLMILGGVAALGIGLLGAAGYRVLKNFVEPPASLAPLAGSPAPAATRPAGEADQGFIYGRVTVVNGTTYEGRLRFGGDEEAFWGDTFIGVKHENPWLAYLTPEQMPKQSHSVELFGWKLAEHTRLLDVTRPFRARIGEVARIDAQGKVLRVTLKEGSVVDLNRSDASGFDGGVRVWDARGTPHLDALYVRTIELLPTMAVADPPTRLYGTVRSRQGDFTGFVAWNLEKRVGSDELDGSGDDVRFDTIRSIERHSHNSSRVTLTDGRDIVLASTNDVGDGNRGVVVEDPRYGRVTVSWETFERVDFAPADSGPGYGDFSPGSEISGTVTTRDGRTLTGRLVYDLDESRTTETVDGSFEGVDYSIPFGMVASIVPSSEHPTRVTLLNGAELQLEWNSDVGEQNAGELVFTKDGAKPEYVAWADVRRIDLDRP